MKKIFTTVFTALLVVSINAQTQIDNSGFENWESVPGGSEPVNWNSFLTADGTLSNFAQTQIEESSDVRPGSAGTKSVRIFSTTILSVVANGNITLGRIHMGSTQATDPSNYNRTVRSDADFNQAMTDLPDSIVFWVKFKPNGGGTDKARMKATIHDDYDYRDPEDANASDHVVGIAELNYPSTGNSWERKSVPFDYSGPATDPQYILVTFATNMTPGGGSGGDEVWIDDIELVYNEASVNNADDLEKVAIYPNPTDGNLTINNLQQKTEYAIVTVLGKTVKSGSFTKQTNTIDIKSLRKGTYFIQLKQGQNSSTQRLIKF